MNVIDISGIRYIKASDAAKRFGYTSDYIGQLSRAGKIDARQIGRAWYVNEEEIRDHKRGNQRSTKQKTHEALQRTIAREPERHAIYNSLPTYGPVPEFRKRLLDTSVAYLPDEHPLAPETRPKNIYAELPVAAEPDAISAARLGRELAIEDHNDISVLEVAHMPEPPMHGELTLTEEDDLDEDAVDSDQNDVHDDASSDNVSDAEPEFDEVPEERKQPIKITRSDAPARRTFEEKLRQADPVPQVTALQGASLPRVAYAPRKITFIPAPLPARRRSLSVGGMASRALLPLMLLLVLVGAFSGVFLHTVIVYDRSGGATKEPIFRSHYGLNQVSMVVNAVRGNSTATTAGK